MTMINMVIMTMMVMTMTMTMTMIMIMKDIANSHNDQTQEKTNEFRIFIFRDREFFGKDLTTSYIDKCSRTQSTKNSTKFFIFSKNPSNDNSCKGEQRKKDDHND